MNAPRLPLLRLLLTLLALCGLAGLPGPARAADGVVGSGSPSSCDEAAFDAALGAIQSSGGGVLSFSCGAQPHTILFSAIKLISAPVEIRGGGLITLSGGNTTPLFQVFASADLTLRSISVVRGYGPAGAVESFGRLSVIDSTLANNSSAGSGGAITSSGSLSLVNATLTSNTAADMGGGVFQASGVLTVTDSLLRMNTAANGGGAIAGDAGSVATIGGGEFAANGVTATFAEGGAIRSSGTLSVAGTLFRHNSGSRGGAVFVAPGGTTTIAGSTLLGNWASYGGAIRQGGGSLAVSGTALAGNGYSPTGVKVTTGGGALSISGGTTSVLSSTLSGNWGSYGGALDHDSGTTTLTNVTLSGNAAVGGGALDQGGGSIALTNVTLYGNEALFFAGGIANRAGTLSATNTLLAGNRNPDSGASSNCYKPIAAGAFSLSSDGTCALGGARDRVALALGPLADNGGPTQTHLPPRGSPAIDAGTGAGCPPADQRGVARPQGQACDVGAVEVTAADVAYRAYLPLVQR